jgi:hypothetical protein
MRNHAARLLPLLLLVAALGGCSAFELEVPANFVELEEPDGSDYALRATNADGVVLAVRQVYNERGGSLEFWRQAIENRVRAVNGYALLEQKAVTAASGEHGFRMNFGRDEGAQTFAYDLAVFLTDDHWYRDACLVIVETGGKKADFDKVATEVERAIAELQLR